MLRLNILDNYVYKCAPEINYVEQVSVGIMFGEYIIYLIIFCHIIPNIVYIYVKGVVNFLVLKNVIEISRRR